MQLPVSTILLTLLPAIAAAADQVPLKEKAAGWLDKAKQYIPSAIPSIPNPVDAGAAKIAEYKVEKINIRNYGRKLGPKVDGEEEWMIYFTGGNKSCFGHCLPADRVWNQSVPILAALPKYKDSTLKLGKVDCDVDEVLCTGWGAGLPAVWHFIFPQKVATGENTYTNPLSPLHEIRLNLTTLTVSELTSIPRASKSTYLETEEYTGFLHPIDGILANTGLIQPWGYFLWGFGSTPSWMIMVGISFFSRQYISRRSSSRPTSWMKPGATPPTAGGAGAGAGTGAAPRAGGATRRK